MSALERVHRARSTLIAVTLLAAVVWGAAAGVLAFGATTILVAMSSSFAGPSAAISVWIAAAVVTLVTVAVRLWQARSIWSLERVALWIEERSPELKYALVTLVDARYANAPRGTGAMALDAVARRADVEGIVRSAARRILGRGLVAVVVAVAGLVVARAVPALGWRTGSSAKGVASPMQPNRLERLRVEVIPPGYSGLPSRIVANPASVAGLAGTTLRFVGDGPTEGITAIVSKKDTLAAVGRGDEWVVPLMMSSKPAIVQLRDRQYGTSIVLEPEADSVPRLLLRLPAKDTTYHPAKAPKGRLELEADIEDDLGIASAFFEILVSTGSAESFDTKDHSTASVAFGGKRRGTLRGSVDYTSLGIAPGTVLHIRAVAFDRNNVASTPGKGVSETRTIRVATQQEYDTTVVTAAAPLPIDTLYVSQRLLNARTDTLIRIKSRVLPDSLIVDTSIVYGNIQTDIRQRVEKTIEIAEDDGVGGRSRTPVSRLLRSASEAMYIAFTSLAIGDPSEAYKPHMQDALRLLDEARAAHKFHLRGALAARPVNIANARLKGRDTASASDRRGRPVPDDPRRALQARLAGITPLAVAAPLDAADSLMAMWIDALQSAPEVVPALKESVELARKGKDVAAAIARARRLLDPPAKATIGPPEWGGMLP